MKLQMLILASLALVDCQLDPEFSVGRLTTDLEFVCPLNRDITPCQCTVVHEIPTVQCNRIRSLKAMRTALFAKFQVKPIPYLKILNARFVGLPSRAFANISMTRLQIEDSRLRYLVADAFAGLDRLLVLILKNVKLVVFPSVSFSELTSLIALSLPENRFFKLEYDDLSTTSRLKYLSLANNKIYNLTRGAFPISLVTLALSNNHLISLNRAIKDLVNLEWLFLNDNFLIDVNGELDQLYSLNHLKLGRNKLSILNRAFRHLSNLHILELQYNEIRELGDSLKNLTQLRTLNLSMNLLIHLNYTDFEGLISLKYLYLSDNRLTAFNGALLHLRSLVSLDLSRNNFGNFSFSEISTLSNLKVLDLNENQITDTVSDSPSIRLRAIRLLLSKNRVSSLSDIMIHFPYLEDIDVSFNKLYILKESDFRISNSIEYINVQGKEILICSFIILSLGFNNLKYSIIISFHELCKQKIFLFPKRQFVFSLQIFNIFFMLL